MRQINEMYTEKGKKLKDGAVFCEYYPRPMLKRDSFFSLNVIFIIPPAFSCLKFYLQMFRMYTWYCVLCYRLQADGLPILSSFFRKGFSALPVHATLFRPFFYIPSSSIEFRFPLIFCRNICSIDS